jgi:hypothetical protein
MISVSVPAETGRFRAVSVLSPTARSAAASIGGMARLGVPDTDPRYDENRRILIAERLAAHIEEVVTGWPPLTIEQRAKLAELLEPVRIVPGGSSG